MVNKSYKNSWGVEIRMSNCSNYIEDPFICDDVGEPKGQCVNCGHKWYEHSVDILPIEDKASALEIQDKN